ncbi:MAG: ATPase [Hyphomicrobiales bacterium]|nr:ATPase [Hyphomicrobiales bacterium]
MLKLKRFYQTVAAVKTDEGHYAVLLDRRSVKTPAGQALALPTQVLAEAIADEWRSQQQMIDPETMPLMKLWATSVDRTGPYRQQVIEDLMRFTSTDLLCYRDEGEDELAARQAASWQPLLDWAAQDLGLRLHVTRGVIPVQQPEMTFTALSGILAKLNNAELTALATVAQISSSVVIGLAVLLVKIDAKVAYELTFLDEHYQAERWGEDAEAVGRRKHCFDELMAAEMFLRLNRT